MNNDDKRELLMHLLEDQLPGFLAECTMDEQDERWFFVGTDARGQWDKFLATYASWDKAHGPKVPKPDELGRLPMFGDLTPDAKALAGDVHWTEEELDLFLNMLWDGRAWGTIGRALGRNHAGKSLSTKHWKMVVEYDGKYRPGPIRILRTGLPWTKRELKAVRTAKNYVANGKSHNGHQPSIITLATLLCRPSSEVEAKWNPPKTQGFEL